MSEEFDQEKSENGVHKFKGWDDEAIKETESILPPLSKEEEEEIDLLWQEIEKDLENAT